ncbi:MAG TPA: carboxypeptidase-like regulatory domain-containing protein, partial [Bryobacteraceae bacterium]
MTRIVRLQAILMLGLCAALVARECIAKPGWVGPNDIGGVVTGARGPEAGVWVIAQTRELGTPRYAKIVVTDDRGRFLLPDLPQADYKVWARGYGIKDSTPIRARGGSVVSLTAEQATPAEAARLYPGGYWYSMLKIPPANAFLGAEPNKRIPAGVAEDEWINVMKQGTCVGCHQLGDEATRTIPKAFASVGSSQAQWVRRIESGQAGPDMIERISTLGPLAFKYLADWTDRIRAGELPKARPGRP